VRVGAIGLPVLLRAYWELVVVASLTGIGAFIRLWRLTSIPWGFHNDEGNVVLDAQRILHEGWIGPYSLLALGYPIAVNYYIAPFIKVFGATVFGVRFPIAVLGIISIPLCYYTIRLAAGWRAALCGTIIYSFSIWHVHLSRVGFPVMGWQVTELGSLLCIQLGIRTRKPWYFLIAGLLIGVGTWVYNSAFLYAVAVAIWIGVWFVLANYRRVWQSMVTFRRDRSWDARPVRDVVLLLILLASTLLAAWPLVSYARDEKNHYTNHFKSVYIFSDERRDACLAAPPGGRDVNCTNTLASGITAKARVVRHNVLNLYHWLTDRSHADGADGLGVKPPVGKIAMYLAIVGAAIALFRIGNAAMGIGLLCVPLIFLSTSVTVDGQFRRSFGLLPFIALFGGLALGLIWEWADRNIVAVRITIVAFLALLLGTYGYQNLRFYFHTYPDSPSARFVFYPEMREASEYLDSVGHPYVYWYNERATLGHESRRVLAPNIAGGEERTAITGSPTMLASARLGLAPTPTASFPPVRQPDGAVFVFFGSFNPLLDEVAQRYPAVEGLPPPVISEFYSDQYRSYDYRAYYLPHELLDYYAQKEGITYIVRPKPGDER
jgi:hypothetical protein